MWLKLQFSLTPSARSQASGWPLPLQSEGVLLEYQWRKDGEDLGDTTRIFGTETSTLVIIKVEPGDAGDYDCLVRELLDGCLAISDVATLTITGLCPADFDGDSDVDAAIVGPERRL